MFPGLTGAVPEGPLRPFPYNPPSHNPFLPMSLPFRHNIRIPLVYPSTAPFFAALIGCSACPSRWLPGDAAMLYRDHGSTGGGGRVGAKGGAGPGGGRGPANGHDLGGTGAVCVFVV